MPRLATGFGTGAGVFGDFPQYRIDALVGEAEPDPHQMSGDHHPRQDFG